MAKSKAGGTRSYLRGKLGADVYQNGKDGKGAKQQVVRSLAEVVDNPRSLAQMRSRMCMSSVAQLMKALKPVIDHSFDGIPNGQPSISHFRSLAMQAYMEDAQSANPKFGYVGYGEKYVPNGNIIVSQGKAKWPKEWLDGRWDQYGSNYGRAGFNLLLSWPKIDGQSEGMPITKQDIIDYVFSGDIRNYVTMIFLLLEQDEEDNWVNPKTYYARVQIDPDSIDSAIDPDYTELAYNKGLIVSGNIRPSFEGVGGRYATGGDAVWQWGITQRDNPSLATSIRTYGQAIILSQYVEGKGYIHSTSSLKVQGYSYDGWLVPTTFYTYTPYAKDYATALATYPQGAARFLNGGEL